MPTLRKAVCGNGIVEESEECDCGTMEECMKLDPCCDPATCKLIMHAECSVGPCCKNCKLLSPDHLCRSSRGECDIPEFCDGKIGQCPEDLFKRNGAVCSSGLGYCFEGLCPVLRNQCQDIWGGDSKFASRSCFERLNILGTPNGNCGFDDKSEIQKCAIENVYCGALQCSEGEKAPVSSETLPINFVVYKMNADGAIHECKALTLSLFDKKHGIIKEGTKCGYKKLCLNHTCTKIRDIVHGKCPHEDIQNTCSSHGVCTNKNTCVCEEGWKGDDCGIVDEEWKLGKGSAGYHDSSEDSNISPHLGNTELKLSPKLAFTVLVSSVIVGLTLVIIVLLFLFYRNPEPPKKVKKSERGKRGH
nr:disintegrin-like halysetin [Parasteatoda tepidariorum]